MSEKLTCDTFSELDMETLGDFMDACREAMEEAEATLGRLMSDQNDGQLINQLFRAMHSLKGNCRMVFLTPMVDLYHELEEIVDDLRKGQPYSIELGDFFLACLERAQSLIQNLISQGQADGVEYTYLLERIRRVYSEQPAKRQALCSRLLTELAGEVEQTSEAAEVLPPLANDLELMTQLARQLDGRSLYREGRTTSQWELCQLMNQLLPEPVDPDQLKAAVLMHDFGMCLVPPKILSKDGALDKEERRHIQQHVHTGTQLLQRMGWEEAARMVYQHHEMFNGEGYPARSQGDAIHPGAQIIAIADTFFSLTNERSDRSYKKTLFGAVKEINANSGTQFDPELVELFNQVIRDYYLKPKAG
ncbi:MAG: Hpt domain-containing protein [Marinobacter sp.]|nr:Hpt domain-containing protein [Marinobacter sp.]